MRREKQETARILKAARQAELKANTESAMVSNLFAFHRLRGQSGEV